MSQTYREDGIVFDLVNVFLNEIDAINLCREFESQGYYFRKRKINYDGIEQFGAYRSQETKENTIKYEVKKKNPKETKVENKDDSQFLANEIVIYDFGETKVEFVKVDDKLGITSKGIEAGLRETQQAVSKRFKAHKNLLSKYSVNVKLSSTDGKYYDTRVYTETGFIMHCMWSTSEYAEKFQEWGANVFNKVITKGMYIDEERTEEKLKEELLTKVYQLNSGLFENLALDIIEKITEYHKYEKIRTGMPNDGGIDGIVNGYIFSDDLGIKERIFMQAKNKRDVVGINEIQRFKGSLNDVLANIGVFITSGYYSKQAIESSEQGIIRISLIDGQQLVEIMINHSIGILSKEYKLIDEIYFKELEKLVYKSNSYIPRLKHIIDYAQ